MLNFNTILYSFSACFLFFLFVFLVHTVTQGVKSMQKQKQFHPIHIIFPGPPLTCTELTAHHRQSGMTMRRNNKEEKEDEREEEEQGVKWRLLPS